MSGRVLPVEGYIPAASAAEQAALMQGTICAVKPVLEQWHLKSVIEVHPSVERAVRKQACEQIGILGSCATARVAMRPRAAIEYFILMVVVVVGENCRERVVGMRGKLE